MSRPTRIVLIGYGPVGARFVEGLVAPVRAGSIELTVVGAETHTAYNRVLLADYAVGRADRARLDLTDTAAAVEAGVRIRLGESAVAIDRDRQSVRLDSCDTLPYDRLVFATGARANLPSLVGLEAARRDRRSRPGAAAALDRGPEALPHGVVALRDLADADTVLEAVTAGRRIVVLGAGVLGMEIALAASERGASVVAVFHGDIPMGRQLDSGGGRALRRAAHDAGVTMAPHSRAESLQFRHREDGEEHFDALVCADGKLIEGDLLLLSCGVGARTELAEQSGLRATSGILVDEQLRSWDDPDIFAIGDCAHVASRSTALPDGRVPGGPAGLIGPGWRQADWLASRLAAEVSPAEVATLSPGDRPLVVMLKAEGIDVVAGGNVSADPWDESSALETTLWADPARGTYAKMVTRDGVLEGFVAVGLPRAGAELTLLFERGGELPEDRSTLLRLDASDAGAAATADSHAPDATVCWCNGVSVQHILTAAEEGATTVEEVGACTRAGTGCGGCKGRIAELLAQSAAPVATR
ncbi:assimilatory nitrate reductase (NADH) beta subunit [Glaciihabitans tibetensis]|uniref:Assimilatory nitrate reductase (NADH) beta subunit n=1 Tax=Glaciihabitans tibetensis TaxID=1266600 RepID=A0A2T0V497_9MICO|nr:FAD-dependent oxidoreductase [Glaciihabitans tibetensis]PRY65009.1 assimilatory nitrate reductase (NADH) beta subunit [Glaciihabitans tibetensis]